MQHHEPLFLTPPELVFEKTAAEVALPEDPNSWPQEILQELYKQVPYISDFTPHVVMERVDGEQGYGFGAVEVSNQTEAQLGTSPDALQAAGIQTVRLPVVISDGKLMPFDILVTVDSTMLPLTEERLREALFRPTMFDVTGMTPGDMSMIGQLYPPYRQNMGFGGGGVMTNVGMGKEGSALEHWLAKEANLAQTVAHGARRGAELLSGSKVRTLERAATKFDRAAETTAKHQKHFNSPEFFAKTHDAHVGKAREFAGKATAERDAVRRARHVAGGAVGGTAVGAAGGAALAKDASARFTAGLEALKVAEESRVQKGFTGALTGSGTGNVLGSLAGAALAPRGHRLDAAYKGGLAGSLGGAAVGGLAGALRREKTASEQALEETAQHLREGRWGKKEASGGYAPGLLDEFIAKHASGGGRLLEAIAPTLGVRACEEFHQFVRDNEAALQKNATALLPAMRVVLNVTPIPTEKVASTLAALLPPSVTQLVRLSSAEFLVKSANAACWDPREERLSRKEALLRFGEKVVLAADASGSATMADEVEGVGDAPQVLPTPVDVAGSYQVQTDDGEALVGVVIPDLWDVTGEQVPLALFTNGERTAIQADIVGQRMRQTTQLPVSTRLEGAGFFFGPGADGTMQATVPMTITGSMTPAPTGDVAEPQQFVAEVFDGRQALVSKQPGVQHVIGNGEMLLIPENWQWSSTEGTEAVALQSMETPEPMPEKEAQVVVRGDSSGQFSFEGTPVAKVAAAEREFTNIDGALFLLGALGVPRDYGVEKLARSIVDKKPTTIKVARCIIPLEEQRASVMEHARQNVELAQALRTNLWKEAAVLTDPTAVDTVLSLGFLSPENLSTFVSYLPEIEGAQRKMCELLLAARLGQSSIPVSALERAVKCTEQTLAGLKSLAFQEQ